MEWLRRKLGAEPPRRAPAESPAEADRPERLQARIGEVIRLVNRSAGELPAAAVVRARRLLDTLIEIVETSAVRPLDVYTVLSVRTTLDDYLPTTLSRYLAVPADARHIARSTGATPADSLLAQLEVLQVSASSVLVAAQNQDVDALMTQGAFLATKFSGSDLDL